MTRAWPGSHTMKADALLRKAEKYERERRFQQAVGAYRQALQVEPERAETLFGLGRLMSRGGHLQEALQLLLRATQVAPRHAPAQLELIDLCMRAGETGRASQLAERACALFPGDPEAHARRALIALQSRRVDEGLAAARRALELSPAHPQATLLAAMGERRAGELEAARARLARLLAQVDLEPRVRRGALHERAVLLDQLGEYVAAFESLERWGAETRATPEAKRLVPDPLVRRIRAWREVLTPELVARHADPPDDGLPTPAFLVGFPRSGTTMTEQILASHPGVHTSGELPLLIHVDQALRGERPIDQTPALVEGMDAARVARLRQKYWDEVRAALPRPLRQALFVDKLPLNIMDVGLIQVLFPRARLIVALRDPRDVCFSCLMQEFQLNVAMANFLSLERTVAFYAEVMGMWLDVRRRITLPVLEVRYEDTVSDLEGHARAMLDFLGLPWDEGVLAFHEKARERTILTPSYEAVTERVHTKAVGRWRNYREAFAPHQETLRPFVEAFGYEEG